VAFILSQKLDQLLGGGSIPHRERTRLKRFDALEVTFYEPIPSVPEPRTDYHWPFYRADGHCSLDHYDTSAPNSPRIRYNSFDLDKHNRITTRSKYQLLLRGDFGSIYSDTTYFYSDTYENKDISFYVHAYSNDLESEPPQILQTHNFDQSRLWAISIIRIFKTSSGYLLPVATYAPDGSFISLSVNNSTDGDCKLGGNVSFVADKRLQQFGFPERFPVQDYINGKGPFTPTTLISEFDCINFHYDRNRVVKQVLRQGDSSEKLRFLTYKISPEDSALEDIDTTRTRIYTAN
jgi:hypothetical protein